MRADRLVSILLLLQASGRMSAGALAKRLEVSRRTIYRDVEALGAAGVPVFTDRGPAGGVSLLEGWRTDVTGLTESEVSALLAFSSSGPASDLGLDQALGQASRKIAVAAGSTGPAPGSFQDRVLIDNNPWLSARRVPAHLRRVQDAVWSDRCLGLRYRRGDGELVERLVEPYGLVAKNGVWYLLAGGAAGLRTYRVSRVVGADLTDQPFTRPPGFDLRRAWAAQTGSFASAASPAESVRVTVRADPVAAARFYRFAGGYLRAGPDDGIAELEFPAPGHAASFLASFVETVEVLEPAGVRDLLGIMGGQLVRLYARASGRREEGTGAAPPGSPDSRPA